MGLPPPEQRRRRRITRRDAAIFLTALREGNSVTHAAARSGHSRQLFYELRHADAAFAQAWQEALDEGCDRLQQTAIVIATKGALEEVRDAEGNLVSTRRRQDPATVRFLLAAHRPQVYSEKHRLELTGGAHVEHRHEIKHARGLTLRGALEWAVKNGVDLEAIGLNKAMLVEQLSDDELDEFGLARVTVSETPNPRALPAPPDPVDGELDGD
jgi:hypothetical protein